jgi:penicillin-binding protein 1C
VTSWLHRATPSAPPAPPATLVAATVDFPSGVEPPRRDWFAAGTEPGPLTRALAAGTARIAAPVDGTIVALDPDIPPDRQRVALEATAAAPGLRWRVDDVDLGAAHGLTLWAPHAGTHTVALVDAADRVVDAATLEVRGGTRSAARASATSGAAPSAAGTRHGAVHFSGPQRPFGGGPQHVSR